MSTLQLTQYQTYYLIRKPRVKWQDLLVDMPMFQKVSAELFTTVLFLVVTFGWLMGDGWVVGVKPNPLAVIRPLALTLGLEKAKQFEYLRQKIRNFS
jgi:hypothetical protein